MSSSTKNKLTLISLILMIFTSVYGFNNIPRAFFKMGYGSIPWYIIGGILFFIPFAFMISELGSAFKNEKGGIYSWMEKSVGPTFALVGTVMWYASNCIWMVSVSNTMLVPLSNVIFGETVLPSTMLVSLFAIVWMIFVTFASIRGLDSIKKFASFGGVAVLLLNVVLIIGAIIVLIANGFQTASPLGLKELASSPNPTFNPSLISFVAFMVYAIFAYGGVEVAGGLVDETENPEKNYPKGIILSAIIITIGYAIAILCVGFFVDYSADWAPIVENGQLHLGNVGYVMMTNLGEAIASSLGLSDATGATLGSLLSRFTGISMFLAYMGAFFTIIYSPIKQLIHGTPEKLWPGKIAHLDDKGMPRSAMIIQCSIVVIVVLVNGLLSLTDEGAADTFFQVLTDMSNVAMTLPYIFIVYAFYKFKTNDKIEKGFVIFKGKSFFKFVVFALFIVVGFANFFTIIEPFVDFFMTDFASAKEQSAALIGATRSTISMVTGPVLFSLIAYFLMKNYLKKNK